MNLENSSLIHIDWWPTVRGDCTWSNKDGLQKCTFEHIYSCPSVRLSNLCKLKNFEVMDYSYQNTTLVLPSCKNWKTTKSMMSLVQVEYSSRSMDIMLQQLWLRTYERFSEKNMNFWARIRTRYWKSESEPEFVNSSNWSSLCNETSYVMKSVSVMWGIWKLSHWLKHYQ